MNYLILITLLFTPFYVFKFSLFELPTNLLMLWVVLVWIIFAGWIISKNKFQEFTQSIKNINNKLLFFIGLFFITGIISLLINGFSQAKLGQFIVLFLQPISIFLISKFIFEKNPHTKNFILLTLYFILALSGAYAVLQYFTLIGLPEAFWGNNVEPKRAIAFFTHPNFYALFSAPLLALLIPDVALNLKSSILNLKSAGWLLGSLGLLLSFSRAGWLGLAVAMSVYLIVVADKKIRKIVFTGVIVMVIVILSTPNLRYRLLLPFYGEKSTVSRLSLWTTGTKAIKEAPILGLGINGFSNNWAKLNTDPNLDTHNYPHNIFLDAWVETGLLGLISFFGIVSFYIYNGFRKQGVILKPNASEGEESQSQRSFVATQNLSRGHLRNDATRIGVALFLICLLTQGLIDNPYFKNDLAMVFWIILSLI